MADYQQEIEETQSKPLLELDQEIGFGGNVIGSLKVLPGEQFLIYPVGSTVVLEDIKSKGTDHSRQSFLTGHTNYVSCVAVSKSGRFAASGQVTHMGFKADVIVWDIVERTQYCKLVLHRNDVKALAFSPNDKYLVSLGGADDGSVVVWNLETKQAICGAPAQTQSAGGTHTIAFFNNDDNKFVSGGSGTLRVWDLNVEGRILRYEEVNVGQIKRIVNCIEVNDDDSFFYCGTTTGDLMKVNTKSNNFQKIGPEKDRFSRGITALALLKTGEFLVGAGDGTVCVVNENLKRTQKSEKVEGEVTSIALRGKGHQFFVGTKNCNIYRFDFAGFTSKLLTTCHFDRVNGIVFPDGTSSIMATCSKHDIRVWNTHTCQEILRITVPDMTCNALAIMKDGRTIVSGWNDGRIRAYYPESGQPMFVIEKSYGGEVTSLATTSDCSKIISGGNLGHVVVWQVPRTLNPKGKHPITVHKHGLLKEHNGKVTCIAINRADTECVTSSCDGSCIIWDLTSMRRKQMIQVTNLFQYVCYNRAENQIITTGTDRKIAYWETYDASMIRDVEGSLSGSVNCMDISSDGKFFVSGGDNKLVKLWNYDSGELIYIGIGHSSSITGIKMAQDGKCIVSVSQDGAIIKWRMPNLDMHCD